MKLEIEIPDEFFERITAEIQAKITSKASAQVDVNYNVKLYNHAIALSKLLEKKSARSFHIVQAAVFDKTGSYKVERYLSDDTYHALIKLLESHCQRNDLWEFVKIGKEYS